MEYDRNKPVKRGNEIPIENKEMAIENQFIKNDTEIIPLHAKNKA